MREKVLVNLSRLDDGESVFFEFEYLHTVFPFLKTGVGSLIKGFRVRSKGRRCGLERGWRGGRGVGEDEEEDGIAPPPHREQKTPTENYMPQQFPCQTSLSNSHARLPPARIVPITLFP